VPHRKKDPPIKRFSRLFSNSDIKQGNFSRTSLVVFVLIFSCLGGYFIYRSFAVTLPPTNLSLLPLDSTIRAKWTPASDASIKWQVASVWTGDGNTANGSQLVSSKVLSPTATAADMNGLRTGDSFTVKIQSMDTNGVLSDAAIASTVTDAQSPMTNAAFFDNFDEATTGDLNFNYFDVRTFDRPNHPADLSYNVFSLDKRNVFASERHFHTQVMGGEDNAGVIVRPRQKLDFNGRTGTVQFEVDLPVNLRNPGKWFEINISQDPMSSEENQGDADSGRMSNDVAFGFFEQNSSLSSYNPDVVKAAQGLNLPIIEVNINGQLQVFTGTTPIFTPSNIRVPIVLKISQNSAEMIVNGNSILKATGFTLPYTTGNVQFVHRANYGTKVSDAPNNAPTLAHQLLHWDTIQFDGQPGTISPTMKTYIQSGCNPVVAHGGFSDHIISCGSNTTQSMNGGSVSLNVPDDISQAKSARFVFNNPPQSGSGTITVNGTNVPFTLLPIHLSPGNNDRVLQLQDLDIPLSAIHQGTNTFTFHFSSGTFTQAELEVSFKQPRVIANPPQMPMKMLNVTTQTFRMERLSTDPLVLNGTTYLYNMGGVSPLAYSASVITPGTPWLKITSPTTGQVSSPATGGGATPLTFSVDYTGMAATGTNNDGDIGFIKVNGGGMPVYVAVLRAYYGRTAYYNILPPSAFPLTTTFNVAGIPDYHGAGTSPAPVPAPSPTPTPTPTPTPRQLQPLHRHLLQNRGTLMGMDQ
jgi:hypothetical protein